MASKRIVVLASGTGTNLDALLAGRLGGTIESVITDRGNAGAIERARGAGVSVSTVPFSAFDDRQAWAEALADEVADSSPDLVVLAGFMRVLPGWFVTRWPMLNVHPSLLPAFPGSKAVESALEWGVKVTGSTIHFVDEQVDHGPIVLQEAVEVRDDDDAASLHERIKAVEHRLLPQAVALFCADRLRLEGRYVRILP